MKEIYKDGLTFKISSKHSDHTFELHDESRELQSKPWEVWCFEAIPTIQAQMEKPDIQHPKLKLEEAAYISYETIRSWWPSHWYVTAGHAHAFLVGLTLSSYLAEAWSGYQAVHFAGPPYTSPGALKSAIWKLLGFGAISNLSGALHRDQRKSRPEHRSLMTLTRRFMMHYRPYS